MLYRKNPKNGKELSILGYGCLRFTKKGGVIDQKKAEECISVTVGYLINNGYLSDNDDFTDIKNNKIKYFYKTEIVEYILKFYPIDQLYNYLFLYLILSKMIIRWISF